jgi:hypothetical protein
MFSAPWGILRISWAPHMRGKPEVMVLEQNKALHSRSELVWNPQPHVRLTQLKNKNQLNNK